jgi:3-oxoacyl-[acyl-carrier protein] reductase
MNIKDKVAVITGASKGIGRSVALAMASAGADVAISARSTDLLESLADEIKETGRQAFVFAGNMAVEKEIQQFIKNAAEHFGRMDILVNNAGLGHFFTVTELTTDLWDEMFNVNVRGLFIATREALPYLRMAGESVIVNITSLAGKNAFVGGTGYAASKHAVLGFSRCLMLEERKNGVRVLAICPGSVDTSFFDRLKNEKHMMPPPNLENALRPDDIASTILHMVQLPQRAMISEVDIRPSNP